MDSPPPTAPPSPQPSPTTSSMDGGGRDLQCVGTLEVVRPKPVGFLCGSIPVPTDKSFHSIPSALLPSPQTVSAPRYRMLPTATDLNTLPVVPNLPEKILPIAAVQSRATEELPWGSDSVSSNLTRKCEALAVSGLAEYGDEIDVIAPTDILKQIFKMPYSKAQLSIAVRRIGQTLVLNSGPDVEEGEKLVRRHNNQPKCADQSLFLNFAMHSVRMEACDCPPAHHTSSEQQSNSSVLPGGGKSQFVECSDDSARNGGYKDCSGYSCVKEDGYFWEGKKSKRNKSHHPVKKASHVGEKPRCPVQESEKHKRVSNDGFLRVLFWQFHNFRMLLGSDLLLFSNDKYVAVSLHLWDVTRQVTPLTWLDAWLDNVMASVPELAICYHHNGVVQGYELLKTEDIFLLKGISEDGTPAFHPYVVQQNGLSVLRFLQENCKQDPGAYWLYKNAGEDVIQLFDLSVIPKNQSSEHCEDSLSSLPSMMDGGRIDSLFSLGTLLYRIAHRLSLSMAPNNRARCARFFQKCLECLDEPDHLVRAFAHEQFARLLLKYDEELELTPESFSVECDGTVPVDSLISFAEPIINESVSTTPADDRLSEQGNSFSDEISEASVKMTLAENLSSSRRLIASAEAESKVLDVALPSSSHDDTSAVCKTSSTSEQEVQNVADPISSRLAAIHHVSQAIKSLRWMRELQGADVELPEESGNPINQTFTNFSICACGDADCIEVCDIREWLPTSKIDHKLWKLVLLLGESYLALGQTYKDDNQLHQALKVVGLACSLYGSMPQHFDDMRFISSIVEYSSPTKCNDGDGKTLSCIRDVKVVGSISSLDSLEFEPFSSTYLFWAKAWTLVGDIYVEFHFKKGREQAERRQSTKELRMSSEVVKEVLRLKKKLGQSGQNCSSCSLVNCSCRSDRANSGSSASSSSASSSSGDLRSVAYVRKHGRRSYAKNNTYSPLGDSNDVHAQNKVKNRKNHDVDCVQLNKDGDSSIGTSGSAVDMLGVAGNRCEVEDRLEMQDAKSELLYQSGTALEGSSKMKNGGIFKYLGDSSLGDLEDNLDEDYNLSAALSCYKEAQKALGRLPTGSAQIHYILKKIGWVCNEMGRIRLERKELPKAELAFQDAIGAFREVSDHTNIILINCNLGHGRRAVAEEIVSKIEYFKSHEIFHNAYKQALVTAKLEYSKSLGYYGAAKSELNLIVDGDDTVPKDLRNEVYTQFAHTYLRLGMLLAREDVTAEVYESGALEDLSSVCISPSDRRTLKEVRKHEISANDAIREALSVYEYLGELRRQEAAFAYFQLACYQRDCCLKFLESDHKSNNLPKVENNILQRVKQYASLAERNWQKAIDFYGPNTHSSMYLNILVEQSALLLTLSSALHSNAMLESALSRMLEGRHISKTVADSFKTDYPDVHTKFWGQLQMLLKKMLALALPTTANKPSGVAQPTQASYRCGGVGKLRELYKMSLKSPDFCQLHNMHTLWIS